MNYIYDILLNFKDNFYEFYEWEKNDQILHVKKIPIFKVESKVIEDILFKKIKLKDNVININKLKTELFGNKRNKYLIACLLTDGYKVIGVKFNDKLEIENISDLLLDEASDAINISNRINISNFEYNIISNKKIYNFLTRNELNIKRFLENELKKIYKNKEYEKLRYLYFEYFNKNSNNIDNIYKELKETLKKNITEKHENLYNLLHLKEECHNTNK